jgi:ribosomal protein S4E
MAKAAKAAEPRAVEAVDVQDGDDCEVVAGAHKGKSGRVEDRNVSKTGHVTITVRPADGVRFKTLGRNVMVTRKAKRAR